MVILLDNKEIQDELIRIQISQAKIMVAITQLTDMVVQVLDEEMKPCPSCGMYGTPTHINKCLATSDDRLIASLQSQASLIEIPKESKDPDEIVEDVVNNGR